MEILQPMVPRLRRNYAAHQVESSECAARRSRAGKGLLRLPNCSTEFREIFDYRARKTLTNRSFAAETITAGHVYCGFGSHWRRSSCRSAWSVCEREPLRFVALLPPLPTTLLRFAICFRIRFCAHTGGDWWPCSQHCNVRTERNGTSAAACDWLSPQAARCAFNSRPKFVISGRGRTRIENAAL